VPAFRTPGVPRPALPRIAVVVEDSPPFTRRIADALAALEERWVVECHESGQAALSALHERAQPPALVLVDLGLPDMDGCEVISTARLLFPEVPIMVISVLTSADAVLKAIRLGARGYLQKEEPALSLTDGLRGVLAGEYPISPSLARHLFRLAQDEPVAHGTAALSAREIDLLRLLGRGYTYDEAALEMAVTLNTVRSYSRRIFQKLDVHRKRDALASARERGLLT